MQALHYGLYAPIPRLRVGGRHCQGAAPEVKSHSAGASGDVGVQSMSAGSAINPAYFGDESARPGKGA